jgi:hypothetical protein
MPARCLQPDFDGTGKTNDRTGNRWLYRRNGLRIPFMARLSRDEIEKTLSVVAGARRLQRQNGHRAVRRDARYFLRAGLS